MADKKITPDRVRSILSDPSVNAANLVVMTLAKRNLDVYFHPARGIVVVGRTAGVQPSKQDMDMAWAARYEIGLCFAMKTLEQQYSAEIESQKLIQLVSTKPDPV